MDNNETAPDTKEKVGEFGETWVWVPERNAWAMTAHPGWNIIASDPIKRIPRKH